MDKTINIFYSWQSDLDKKLNNFFIKECVQAAIKEIKRENLNLVGRIELDHDTKNKSGSPNIIDTILRKIDSSDIFICDITIVNKQKLIFFSKKRNCPNPNVMLELGYAINSIGWERVICINNLAINTIEELPFDIKQNRISTYFLKSKRNKSKSKQILKGLLKTAINSIIEKNPSKNQNNIKARTLSHDTNLFNKIEIVIPEKQFLDEVEIVSVINRINSRQIELFNLITDFYELESNRFLNDELNKAFGQFITALQIFYNYTGSKMFSINENNNDTFIDKNGKLKILSKFGFTEYHPSLDYDKWQHRMHEQNMQLAKLSKNVTNTYNTFRKAVKEQLYV